MQITPALLSLLGDQEECIDFIDSLNQNELSIMIQHSNDTGVLKRLILQVRGDIEETAKDLAIED